MEVSKKRIDQFLAGELKGQDLIKFLEQFRDNPNLKKRIEERELELAIEANGNQQLKKRLNKIQDEEQSRPARSTTSTPEAKVKKFNPMWLVAAASVALLILASIYFLKPQPAERNNLFADYYEVYQPNLVERNSSSTDDLVQIEQFIKAKKYEQAIPVLEEKLSMTKNAKLDLALGTCYLESGKYNKAVKQFKTAKENVLYQDKAYWYSALTYVKDGKWKKAQKELSPLIANSKSEFHQKAKDLSTALDRKK